MLLSSVSAWMLSVSPAFRRAPLLSMLCALALRLPPAASTPVLLTSAVLVSPASFCAMSVPLLVRPPLVISLLAAVGGDDDIARRGADLAGVADTHSRLGAGQGDFSGVHAAERGNVDG